MLRARAVLPLLAAALSACGPTTPASPQSRGTATTTASRPTVTPVASPLLARANKVCAVYYAEAFALPTPVTEHELSDLPAKQQTLRETELAGLRALVPTSEGAGVYAKYVSEVATLDERLAMYVKPSSTTTPGQPSTAKAGVLESAIVDIQRASARVTTDGMALGLTECVKNPYTAIHTSKSP